jgi:protein-S-isoprenylcysteine O-methyltransferase Ste14
MKKLNFLGIGPKVAVILLPWLMISIGLSIMKPKLFMYPAGLKNILFVAGIILMTTGLIFYTSTARALLRGLKETRLVTTGPYRVCQNPLYTSFILFIIPALSLLLNSWLILTAGVLGYILFKRFIKSEYHELEEFFGEEYIKYHERTPEFFPFQTGRLNMK